jgi:hypothetical protein
MPECAVAPIGENSWNPYAVTSPAFTIAKERQLWSKSTISNGSGVRIRRNGKLPFDLN